MTLLRPLASVLALFLSLTPLIAQSKAPATNLATTSTSTVIVPPLIRMSGTLRDASAKPLTGTAGVTFALYKEQEGGEALWIETQNVSLDSTGRYNMLMGATRAEGIPMEVFTSGDARWLEVSVQGRTPQPRVLLVSVPYALKAQEAETLAGKPASQYVSADILKQQVHQEVQAEMQSGTAGSASRKTQISSPNAATSSGATNFSGSTADQIVSVTQTGAGYGINAVAASNIGVLGVSKGASGAGVYGIANNTGAGTSYGLRGDSYTVSGRGMRGVAFGSNGVGVQSTTLGATGYGNLAESRATTGVNAAIYAIDNSPAGIAGIFDNRGGGEILSLRRNGAEIASLGSSGTFTSASSAGNGVTGSASLFPGSGVFGQWGTPTATGNTYKQYYDAAGVWGDGPYDGVIATTDDGNAIQAFNNSQDAVTLYVTNNTPNGPGVFSSPILAAFVAPNAPPLHSGYSNGCLIDIDGNLTCSGTITGSTRILPKEDPGKGPAPSVRRAPKPEGMGIHVSERVNRWAEDFGSAQLQNGTVKVSLKPGFSESIDAGQSYHVFFTPRAECEGLYVASQSASGFEVKELHGGKSNLEFDYRIVARPRGSSAPRTNPAP
jgi:hypothetical protein